MSFTAKKGQTSIEFIVIVGAIVLPLAYIMGDFFKDYIKFYSGTYLSSSFQAQVRYGLGMEHITNLNKLGNADQPALEYDSQVKGKHPFSQVTLQ